MKAPRYDIRPARRGVTLEGERNDCTVRALANAHPSLSYAVAHAALKVAGRRDRCAVTSDVYIDAYRKFGFKLHSIYGTTKRASNMARNFPGVPAYRGITLGNLLNNLPLGRFIVTVSGHNLAVVDGKVVDTFASSSNKSVAAVFRFVG